MDSMGFGFGDRTREIDGMAALVSLAISQFGWRRSHFVEKGVKGLHAVGEFFQQTGKFGDFRIGERLPNVMHDNAMAGAQLGTKKVAFGGQTDETGPSILWVARALNAAIPLQSVEQSSQSAVGQVGALHQAIDTAWPQFVRCVQHTCQTRCHSVEVDRAKGKIVESAKAQGRPYEAER